MRARPSVVSALLAVSLGACGTQTDDTDDFASNDEFLEAVPEDDALALTLDEGDAAEQGLSSSEAALDLEPARLRELTRDVFGRVNELTRRTRQHLRESLEGVEPETFSEGKVECKRWETDGERAHWRFTSCRRDKKNRVFAFKLEGRPLDGASEYAVVFAGEGRVLARFDDKKRGAGRVGYDFDALNALTGEGPTGKLGIGYRAAGRVRQLHLGLHALNLGETGVPTSARYHYQHVLGVGGHVALRAHADVVLRGEDGALALGDDGVAEWARARLGWKRGVGARAAVAVCGGTVGEGECVKIKQCWSKDGAVEGEDVGEGSRFERACPQGPVQVEEAPSEDEVGPPPAEDGELPGPAMDEPAADPAESL